MTLTIYCTPTCIYSVLIYIKYTYLNLTVSSSTQRSASFHYWYVYIIVCVQYYVYYVIWKNPMEWKTPKKCPYLWFDLIWKMATLESNVFTSIFTFSLTISAVGFRMRPCMIWAVIGSTLPVETKNACRHFCYWFWGELRSDVLC